LEEYRLRYIAQEVSKYSIFSVSLQKVVILIV
jgi:hypothetical protein